jgi:hypothetical protein
MGLLWLQAQGLGQAGDQYDDWVQHRKVALTSLVHRELGTRTRTHAVLIELDYHPRGTVPFQVSCCERERVRRRPFVG